MLFENFGIGMIARRRIYVESPRLVALAIQVCLPLSYLAFEVDRHIEIRTRRVSFTVKIAMLILVGVTRAIRVSVAICMN